VTENSANSEICSVAYIKLNGYYSDVEVLQKKDVVACHLQFQLRPNELRE